MNQEFDYDISLLTKKFFWGEEGRSQKISKIVWRHIWTTPKQNAKIWWIIYFSSLIVSGSSITTGREFRKVLWIFYFSSLINVLIKKRDGRQRGWKVEHFLSEIRKIETWCFFYIALLYLLIIKFITLSLFRLIKKITFKSSDLTLPNLYRVFCSVKAA